MCESVEFARIIDVSGTLLKTTCRQNSAICSLSIMAKTRPPEKIDHINDMRALIKPTVQMSSSLGSSSSYSSSLDSEDGSPKCPRGSDHRSYDDLDDIISGINDLRVFKSEDEDAAFPEYPVCKMNLVAGSDDDKCAKLSEDEDDADEAEAAEGELVERGPVRPQMNPAARSRPYVESAHLGHHWCAPTGENSTDYDTSAKAILTDREYREKIDFCLDKLSEVTSSGCDSLSPTHSDFGGASAVSGCYSPQEQHHQHQQGSSQADQSPTGSRHGGASCLVPSITVCDSESSLLEILSRGGFQPAQTLQTTPEHRPVGTPGSVAASDHWPDSPSSSSNAYGANSSASRPDSRASSRAQSPGSNGCGTATFLNVLGSPSGSPQVSPQAYRFMQRPSSSSSSSQSYCETPSPANYQSPLDQHAEEQLGDQMLSRLPVWHDSFESTDTLVNGVSDSSELQLQLVEEVIRGDMNQVPAAKRLGSPAAGELQVVPQCAGVSSPAGSSCTSYSVGNSSCTSNSSSSNSSNSAASCSVASSCLVDGADGADELTNTLLRFVGGDRVAGPSHRKVEARCSPSTSGYSSSSSCTDGCLALDRNPGYLDGPRSLGMQQQQQQQQQQQSVYQPQLMNLNTTINVESLQISTASVELLGKNVWQSYADSNSIVRNSSSSTHFGEFQIPETVTSFNSQSKRPTATTSTTSVKQHALTPLPSLNLPLTRASERLKELTDPNEVKKAMASLLKKSLDELAKPDAEGDTMLMCLAGNPQELQKKLAYLAPLVERLGSLDGALTTLNNRGEDALYLAAMNCPKMAFVAGYLAARLLQKNIDIGQRTYRDRGDTLIHSLAAKGDTHGDVLAELLSLRTAQGNPVFDLSSRNFDGRTALHVAVEAHGSIGRNTKTTTLATTRLLLENGADPLLQEVRCGETPLHLAISLSSDLSLVKSLLMGRGKEVVNTVNYSGNTPLHLAASISDRTSEDRQLEICWLLIHAGAKPTLVNRMGKVPLALVSAGRRDALKHVFYKKSL